MDEMVQVATEAVVGTNAKANGVSGVDQVMESLSAIRGDADAAIAGSSENMARSSQVRDCLARVHDRLN
jgi:hypothetical protein